MEDSAGEAAGGSDTARAPVDVVLVGGGERARAWLALLSRSPRLHAVAGVARGTEVLDPELARCGSLEEAIEQYPAAVFAVALPPRAGLEAALQLVDCGRTGVLEAPLHVTLADLDLPPTADAIRVAHGWVTLPGVRAMETIMRRAGGRLTIDVSGLPEAPAGDLDEVLVHAAALVRTLVPQARPTTVRSSEDGVEAELSADAAAAAWTVALRVRQHGQRLAVRVEGGATEPAVWSWERDRETVLIGGKPLIPARPTAPAPARALAQLLPEGARGDGLRDAAAVLRLARACWSRLPNRLVLGARVMAQSASIARRRPCDLLARLGLRGELPTVPRPAPDVLAPALPPEPMELWAFRAGVKPVAFLTVRPEDVDRTLACFGSVPYERRERRVRVDAQDRWTDRRDEGEPYVELYIAGDAALARRAAQLQAENDPTRSIVELGALVGYPSCCVAAFAAQDDRANNSRNRYYSQARTLRPDGSMAVPWPWQLNNLDTMLLPFYPCTYCCGAAVAQARACLAEMARVHPRTVDELRAAFVRPVLYFDHDHQLSLDGTHADGWVAYRAVAVNRYASPEFVALAAAIGTGDRLRLDDRKLLVLRGDEPVLRLERTDPALGFLAPFGP